MPSDAIVILKQDHKTVKGLFRDFERSGEDLDLKQQLVSQIIEELTVHTFLENTIVYPAVREALPDLESDVMESYEEHHVRRRALLGVVGFDAAKRALRGEGHGVDGKRSSPHRRGRKGLVS